MRRPARSVLAAAAGTLLHRQRLRVADALSAAFVNAPLGRGLHQAPSTLARSRRGSVRGSNTPKTAERGQRSV